MYRGGPWGGVTPLTEPLPGCILAPTKSRARFPGGHVLQDPEIVVDYHMKGQVQEMRATDANPPVRTKATLADIKSALSIT